MRIIYSYIGKTILTYCSLTLLVLTSLSSLIKCFDQLRLVGRGTYTLFDTFIYTLYLVPKDIEMFAPMAILIGSLLAMGGLASRSELVILQSAGLSKLQIITASMLTTLPLIIVLMCFSEFLAPKFEDKALQLQSVKISGGDMLNTMDSVWSKDHNNYINIGKVTSLSELHKITFYEFNEKRELEQVTFAQRADYQDDHWILSEVEEKKIYPDHIEQTLLTQKHWYGNLTPEKLKAVATRVSSMSMQVLLDYIAYLKGNNQDYSAYTLAFARKLVLPLNMMVMSLLSLAFIFGSPRHSTMGSRIIIGLLMGFGFYIMNEVSCNLSLVFHIPVALATTLPSLLFIGVSIRYLRK